MRRRRPAGAGALLAWLLLALALAAAAPARAATPACPGCLRAGAATVRLPVPVGTPLAGYGSFKRRLLFPDVLGRYPHAFWFTPSAGELDAVVARALVLEGGGGRLTWVTVDVIAVDREFTAAVARRLEEAGLGPGTLIVSASHTHSGPGAFGRSALWAFIAVDRLDGEVREAVVNAVVEAVRRATLAKVLARVGTFVVTAPPVTVGRIGQPVDREIVGLKVVRVSGEGIALVWNFAIHGTMLGPGNRLLSGDVMGIASRALERDLRVPALFVNGAVGDVSPHRHGPEAVLAVGDALAAAVRDGWARSDRPLGGEVTVRSTRVPLPSPHLSLRNCLGRWIPGPLALPLGRALPADAEMTAVAVGGSAWVTIPGELQSALGESVKRAARPPFAHAFVAGLSNDYLGYFVTARAYRAPGYVTCASLYGASAGERLAEAGAALLRELAGAHAQAERRGGGAGLALRGDAAGEGGLLAGGGVAVDHALGHRLVQRADGLAHRTLRLGTLGDGRRASRLDGAAEAGAERPVAQAAALALVHPLDCRLRVRHVGTPPWMSSPGRAGREQRRTARESCRIGGGIANPARLRGGAR